MSGVPVGQRAVGLPWLCPSPGALLGLTADPPDGSAVASDPAMVAHLFRFARPTPTPADPLLCPSVLSQPGVCANAATLLESAHPHDPSAVESLRPIHRVIQTASKVAARLAGRSGTTSPDVAACVTCLVPIGWWAVATVDPTAVNEVLGAGGTSASEERRRLGLDFAAIGRRLAARWRLPRWVAATFGSVRLERFDAERLGAPPELFSIVQAAVAAAERRHRILALTDDRVRESILPLSTAADDEIGRIDNEPGRERHDQVSGSREIFVRLLRSTAKLRQASGAVWLAEAEDRVDRLSEALISLRGEFDERLRDAKLASLAEFAAGASHEINNPLAVISGHAQLLLAAEDDPDRRKQLGTIIRQTKRVHELLQGTLQFARPPRPSPGPLRVRDLVAEVLERLRAEAEAKSVDLRRDPGGVPVLLGHADPGQIRQALTHLVRNAIDAVPPGGWVHVGIEHRDRSIVVAVDDSGPGPDRPDVEHLFDPFFSGRSAGRGRGLGLAIAWRLAQVNGATVRYRPDAGPATRFELILPDAAPGVSPTYPVRRSA